MTNVPLNIDFSQILLHLFNFIILAGGLYFLLYKPTKSFMDKREAYYKDIDDKAKKTLADCESEKQKYKNLISEAQSQADAIKANALKEADVMAKEHIKSAEDAKAKIISDAKKSAEIEKDKILAQANSQIEQMVSEAIDKVLIPAGKNSFDDFLESARKE